MKTSIVNKAYVRGLLPLIQGQVRHVERKLLCREIKAPDLRVTERDQRIFEEHGDVYIDLPGEHEPVYHGTPITALANYLDELKKEVDLPESFHFADLGSGLGSACFAAAAHFDMVTGFETNQTLREEAENLRQFYMISSIRFRNEDFTDADLRPFNVVYFFKPYTNKSVFMDIHELLLGTAPGTVIISRSFMPTELHDRFNFRFLGALEDWMSTAEQPYLPLADFYPFVRK